MPPKARASKGILGVPKRAGRQVFVFGRYAEDLPSDESDDPDFRESDDPDFKDDFGETSTSTAAKTKGSNRKRNEKGSVSIKGKVRKQEEMEPTANKTDAHNVADGPSHLSNVADGPSHVSKGWTELIPTEILLIIFQHAMKKIIGSSIPFLCRMSRVCHQWREVALEPRLWRTVNLSTSVLNIKTSPKILQTLATTRLKYTTHLSLEGWSKLTDKGIKVVGKHCKDLQSIKLAQCESLTSQGIASLADKCQHLKRIDVESTKINISGLQHIIEVLGSQLESLCLQNCTHLRGELILPLVQENCPNLEFLDLSCTNIRIIHIERLQAGCPKLEGLSLSSLLLNSTPMAKTKGKAAHGFPNLKYVDLSCTFDAISVRNDQFLHRILWASKDLQSLIIRGPNLFTAEGFRNLPDCPLKHLTYNNATFPKVAAIVEKWHNTLTSLDISSNRGVDDQCMDLLRNFGMPKLRSLNLSSTNITSEGVRTALNACPNLHLLDLSGCRGLPRGVKSLHGELGIRSLPWKLAEAEEESD